LIIPLIILVILNGGDGGNISGFWDNLPTIGMGVAVLFVLISGIIRWLRFTYRIESGELRIEYGLFVKKRRYIPFDRIQSLNVTEGPLQRLFGLVKVEIETAGSSNSLKAEAVLTAISKAEATELTQVIREEKPQISAEEQDSIEGDTKIVYRATYQDLFIMAATSGGAGVVISAIFAFSSQFQELIPYEKIFREAERFVESGMTLIVFLLAAVLLLVWLLSIMMTLLKYGNFTLSKFEDQLIIGRGLLERQSISLPFTRIQGITIVESPIRQIFGYASVYVESAGGIAAETNHTSVMIIPLVKKKHLQERLKNLFPDYHLETTYLPAPRRAVISYISQKMIWVLFPIAGISWLFWPLGVWSLLLVIPAAIIGYLDYRSAGWRIDQHQLSLSFRKISKHTMLMKKHRIQSLDLKQNWWQKNRGLAGVEAVIKAGSIGKGASLFYMDEVDAKTIFQWYRHEYLQGEDI
ncbi:MAG TPA: PH domain-containing protein, partial [Chondromyces sp.]|nr:PH domain-containing protein [Chondromyces sp.]